MRSSHNQHRIRVDPAGCKIRQRSGALSRVQNINASCKQPFCKSVLQRRRAQSEISRNHHARRRRKHGADRAANIAEEFSRNGIWKDAAQVAGLPRI
jgi:hypothetical protein